MTAIQIIFLGIAALVLWAALMVVTQRNLVRAALWLVVALFGVAGIFVLLEAGFLAVAQVIIYIGAIAILFIFAVMMTRKVMGYPKDSTEEERQTNSNWWVGALIAAALFGGLFFVLTGLPGAQETAPAFPEGLDTVQMLGEALVSPTGYLVPFEVASALLLAALIGAIYVANAANPTADKE